jgi:hypothetical protein
VFFGPEDTDDASCRSDRIDSKIVTRKVHRYTVMDLVRALPILGPLAIDSGRTDGFGRYEKSCVRESRIGVASSSAGAALAGATCAEAADLAEDWAAASDAARPTAARARKRRDRMADSFELALPQIIDPSCKRAAKPFVASPPRFEVRDGFTGRRRTCAAWLRRHGAN